MSFVGVTLTNNKSLHPEGECPHNMCEPLIAGLVDNDHNVFFFFRHFFALAFPVASSFLSLHSVDSSTKWTLPIRMRESEQSKLYCFTAMVSRPSLFSFVLLFLPFFYSLSCPSNFSFMSKHNHKFSSRLPIFFYNNGPNKEEWKRPKPGIKGKRERASEILK